jgi:hypothetical protein
MANEVWESKDRMTVMMAGENKCEGKAEKLVACVARQNVKRSRMKKESVAVAQCGVPATETGTNRKGYWDLV